MQEQLVKSLLVHEEHGKEPLQEQSQGGLQGTEVRQQQTDQTSGVLVFLDLSKRLNNLDQHTLLCVLKSNLFWTKLTASRATRWSRGTAL